jgi:hypothetical protein
MDGEHVTNMRVLTMAAIRNARGLTSAEKAMLYTIESRGEVFSSAETFRGDCGMGRNKFYDVRGSLLDKGLVQAEVRRPRGTTVYRVDHEAVAAMTPMRDEQALPPLETLNASDVNVSHGRHFNVAPVVTPTSPTAGSQREPWKGSPQGDPERGTIDEAPEGFRRGKSGLLRPMSPIYIRLVRTHEMTTPEKHRIGEMTPAQRAEWQACIDAEANLP